MELNIRLDTEKPKDIEQMYSLLDSLSSETVEEEPEEPEVVEEYEKPKPKLKKKAPLDEDLEDEFDETED